MATIDWASDSESDTEFVDDTNVCTDEPRTLTSEEIEGIVGGIRFGINHNPIQANILHRHQEKTRQKLSSVSVRPSKIPELKKIILQQFYSSVIACGEAVGVNAAQCIGEPTTQMTELATDRVIVYSECDGTFYRGTIGDFVDDLMGESDIIDLGSGSEVTYLSKKERHLILTVNPENEKCEWKPLCEVSRHPANGDLAQITTKSGRKVTTTMSHSHLQRTADGKITPIVAADLKVGDFIPVAKRIPHREDISTIKIGGDTVDLDFDLGWYFGAYLAEGCAQGNTVTITNQSEHFENRCRDICKRFDADYKKRVKVGGFEAGYAGVDHMIRNNNGLGKFTKNEFKTGSANKRVPGWVYFAPLPFIKGLLRGYFDGDGNVNAEKQLIRVHSISRLLLEDISLLLSYFGIFSTLKVEKPNAKNPLYNLVLLRKFAKVFQQEIGSDFPEKCEAIQEIVDYNEREDVHSRREDIDRIPMCGQLIADTALPLKLPGYSRNYKRWINKPAVGRETLNGYLTLFEKESLAKDIDNNDNIELIRQAVNSDIVWDEIKSIEKIATDVLVYDFGVKDNHTFMVNAGVLVHNTLNSVSWDTDIILQRSGNGEKVHIGEWIDQIIEENTDKIVHIEENRTEYCELDDPTYIPTVSASGNVTWGQVTAVTRHLPMGKLVKVTTRSGRSVVATRSKSFLVWSGKEFVQTPGADIQVGDKVPVTETLCEPDIVYTTVDLEKYLPKTEWIYGTDLHDAHDEWSTFKRAPTGWWTKNNGVTFTLPYNRSDTAMATLKKTTTCALDRGFVYPLYCRNVRSRVPERITLDEEFGFIVGIYLAEGWATDTFVGISNNDDIIMEKVRAWVDSLNITHHTVVTESNRFEGAKSTDLKIHSVIIARWFKKWLGTGSSNKVLPNEAYTAPKSFLKGLLDGYFSGDGTVNKRDGYLVMSSASAELIEGISFICSRFSIYGKISSHQPASNNIGSKDIKLVNTLSIRNAWAVVWAKEIGSTHPDKQKRLMNISHEKFGRLYSIVNDVILDTVVSVEDCESDHEKVYDLTVPSTTNFSIANGLGVADTFHHTGQSAKNVTLGFPRARELFNATKSPSNPSCTVYFTRDNSTPEELHKMVNRFPQASIEQIIEGWEVFEPEDYELVYWHTAWFKMNPNFGDLTEDDWCLRLKFDISQLYENDLTVKVIAKRLEHAYADIRCIPSPLNIGIVDVLVNCAEINISGARSDDLSHITDGYESQIFYMNKIVSPKIRGHMICGIPGITKLYRRKAKVNESYGDIPLKKEIQERLSVDEEWIIDTDGTNLSEVLTQPGVDSYRTISNEMWEIMNIFGIEAARAYLDLEFMNIVSSGGVNINPVHIQVLIDKMTYTGSIRAIARFGVETAQYDPIARATFEEVMSQIITSAMFSEKDNLNGISSNIVLGTKINAGTGRIGLDDIPIRVVRPSHADSASKTKIRPPKQNIVTEDI